MNKRGFVEEFEKSAKASACPGGDMQCKEDEKVITAIRDYVNESISGCNQEGSQALTGAQRRVYKKQL